MCFMTMVQYKVKIISFIVMHSDGSNEFLGPMTVDLGLLSLGKAETAIKK